MLTIAFTLGAWAKIKRFLVQKLLRVGGNLYILLFFIKYGKRHACTAFDNFLPTDSYGEVV